MKTIEHLYTWDTKIIRAFKEIDLPFARISLFIVFFWFGLLKVIGASPANSLVAELLERTLPFITFPQFILLFGIFEMLIGVLFLIPKAVRIVMPLLGIHMITTILPLFVLPTIGWQAPFIPTLEGQYIIKNVVLIAVACVIAANTTPLRKVKKPTA